MPFAALWFAPHRRADHDHLSCAFPRSDHAYAATVRHAPTSGGADAGYRQPAQDPASAAAGIVSPSWPARIVPGSAAVARRAERSGLRVVATCGAGQSISDPTVRPRSHRLVGCSSSCPASGRGFRAPQKGRLSGIESTMWPALRRTSSCFQRWKRRLMVADRVVAWSARRDAQDPCGAWPPARDASRAAYWWASAVADGADLAVVFQQFACFPEELVHNIAFGLRNKGCLCGGGSTEWPASSS